MNMKSACRWCAFLATSFLTASVALAQTNRRVDLTTLSLEELLQIEITSVGKRSQRLADTAAAVFVITADDIDRSSATTIMELLRQVPGALVAREATGEWSISIRGFNDKHANKLLVLMDGRTLYSPLYSGVEWDIQDTFLADIDRIEVIRGPGASIWGANAVNGVINIITKDAKDTQGGLVRYRVGRLDRGTLEARYGGSFGEHVRYRVFSKYFTRPSLPSESGPTATDGWNGFRQGGRVDWSASSRDHVSVSSEWFVNNLYEMDDELTSFTPPFSEMVTEHDKTSAGFIVSRWTRTYSTTSTLNAQFFYDRVRQFDGLGNDKDESIDTTDVDVSHSLRLARRHDIVWGGGLRQVRDRVKPAIDSWFIPAQHTAGTFNIFVQDQISLFDDALQLTVGSKIEWNDFTSREFQPTVRALWKTSPAHGIWGAASKAARLPSRFEMHERSVDEIDVDDDGGIVYDFITGAESLESEKLTAYEAGYRFIPNTRFSTDVSAFYNVYDTLFTVEQGDEFDTEDPVSGVRTPFFRDNLGYGRVYGFEAVAYWTVNDAFQLTGSVTRLHMDLQRRAASTDEDVEGLGDNNAKNLFSVRSYVSLPYDVDVNTDLRFVGAIPGQEVPRYFEGNVHVSRPLRGGLRLGLTLENIFNGTHTEWDFEDGLSQPRSARLAIDWRF